MNNADEDIHFLSATCSPFDSWDQRDKAYNIFCHWLVNELNDDTSSKRQEFDEKFPNKLLEDLLVFATEQWRALLPKHGECVALLNNTVQGAYETYPVDMPEWINIE